MYTYARTHSLTRDHCNAPCVRASVSLFTCACLCCFAYMQVHEGMYIYAHMYLYTYIYINIHTCTYTHMLTYAQSNTGPAVFGCPCS